MFLVRRCASLLLLPLVFQFVLAARDISCVATVSETAAGMSTMAGMNMSAAETHERTPSSDRHHSPCNRPFSSDCQPLAACATGVLTPAPYGMPELAAERHDLPSAVVVASPSRTPQPEPPPPRA